MRDSEIFDEAIKKYFVPIAQELGLPLTKIADGIYEIPSPHFIMRIRLHTGHRRGLNVFLRETSFNDYDESKPGSEYGLGWFMGDKLKQIEIEVDTDDDFIKQTKVLADAAEQFGIPYLLGQKNDLEAIREMIKKRNEANESERDDLREILRNIERNMPSVRQEWPVVTPPEVGEKRATAREIEVSGIHFLGDQDGDAEQMLKEKLAKLFAGNRNIKTAYLARFIGYGTPANSALCLSKCADSNQDITEQISPVFESIFGQSKQLNVVFLTDEQESSIRLTCHPFFERV